MAIRYIGPGADKKAPLYLRLNDKAEPQPAYLLLNETGDVEFTVVCALDFVRKHRTIAWPVCPYLTGQACVSIYETLTPLLERVHAGHSLSFGGLGTVGVLTEDARAACDQIEHALEVAAMDDTNRAYLWEVSEWLLDGETPAVVADVLSITADTSDEELSALAETFAEAAEQDDVVLEGDILPALMQIRSTVSLQNA